MRLFFTHREKRHVKYMWVCFDWNFKNIEELCVVSARKIQFYLNLSPKIPFKMDDLILNVVTTPRPVNKTKERKFVSGLKCMMK